MQMTPVIAIHMTAALAAIAIGPVALWARQGRVQRPRLHRAFGYAWVTLILATAISAVFIRDFSLPNIAGYTPIHLLVPYTLYSLVMGFVKLARRDIAGHRAVMRRLYIGACVVAGLFTLVPGRTLGNFVWGTLLGLVPADGALPPLPPVAPVAQMLALLPSWIWIAAVLNLVLAIAFLLRTRQPH